MILNFEGILVGAFCFLIIGLFHPIVIKTEYHWGTRFWWIFLLLGIGTGIATLFIPDSVWSIVTGITSCCFLWSIKELFEQKERVRKGWFPRNPNRKED